MLTKNLQTNLTAHLKKIRGRKAFIDKWCDTQHNKEESFDKRDAIDDVTKMLHEKVYDFLLKDGFKFGKTRNKSRSLIDYQDGYIVYREYKYKSFCKVDFFQYRGFDEIKQFLPEGLIRAIGDIEKETHSLNRAGDIESEFLSEIKFRKPFILERIDNDEFKIKKETIKSIKLYTYDGIGYSYYRAKEYKPRFSSESEESYSLDYNSLLYHDKFFKKILKLQNKYEKHLMNVLNYKNKLIDNAINKINLIANNFEKYILLEDLR